MSTGVVAEVHVKKGDQVKEGDLLLVLEAMKMLNRITSTRDGGVQDVMIKDGQAVQKGDLLILIRPKRFKDT